MLLHFSEMINSRALTYCITNGASRDDHLCLTNSSPITRESIHYTLLLCYETQKLCVEHSVDLTRVVVIVFGFIVFVFPAHLLFQGILNHNTGALTKRGARMQKSTIGTQAGNTGLKVETQLESQVGTWQECWLAGSQILKHRAGRAPLKVGRGRNYLWNARPDNTLVGSCWSRALLGIEVDFGTPGF